MGAEQSSGRHAAPRRRTYRSGGKRAREESETQHLESVLDILETNDFSTIAHTRFPKVKGTLSWAKLGEYACDAIKRELAAVRDESDLQEAMEHAKALQSRLRVRDNVKGARTTNQLRDAINNLAALTQALFEMIRIRSGALKPDHDNGARATVIKQKWVRLSLGDSPWAKRLMEETVAFVLASNASGGVKSLFNKAVASWLPSPAPSAMDGEKVIWDSEDDL
jgi:hypothetical protein